MRQFSIICAIDDKNGFAKENKIPWFVPKDLKQFRKITYGHTIIMGKKTRESIGRDLPGRENIIVNKSIIDAFRRTTCEKIFVIGGVNVINQLINSAYCDKIYLSRISGDYNCDLFLDIPNEYEIEYQEFHKEFIYQILRRPENAEEKQYLNLIKKVLATPERMIFGHQMRFSLNRFPLLTTKKMFWRGIAEELLWFISGDTNNKTLTDKNIHIWSSNLLRKFDKLFFASQKITSIIEDKTENKTEDKIENKTEDKTENKTEIIFCEAKNNLSSLRSKEEDLGPIYGYQWRRFGGCFDQLAHCINLIKTDPNSRRIVMSAWNPLDIPKMALPPCHVLVQFHVSGKKLSAHMYQRSADIGLGMPFNISSYSLLIYLIAQVCDLIPYEFIYSIGNTHIYKEHESALKEQLTRRSVQFPILKINNNTKDIDNFKFTDFELVNYNCYSDLKMPLIV